VEAGGYWRNARVGMRLVARNECLVDLPNEQEGYDWERTASPGYGWRWVVGRQVDNGQGGQEVDRKAGRCAVEAQEKVGDDVKCGKGCGVEEGCVGGVVGLTCGCEGYRR